VLTWTGGTTATAMAPVKPSLVEFLKASISSVHDTIYEAPFLLQRLEAGEIIIFNFTGFDFSCYCNNKPKPEEATPKSPKVAQKR